MPYECRVKEVIRQPTLSIRGTCTSTALTPTTGEFLREVWDCVAQRGPQRRAGRTREGSRRPQLEVLPGRPR